MVHTRLMAMLLLFGMVIALTPYASGAEDKPAREAPDFVLTTLEGKTLKFSDYRGKVVLLDFWATWCVPCRTEIPRFVAFQKRFSAQGFQVIGISMDDSTAAVRRFYTRFNMNYPVALGDPKVADQFGGVLGLPLTFLITRDGTIFRQYDGDSDLDKMEHDISLLLQSRSR